MTRQVTWDRGVALVGHGLWLDPVVTRDLAFVSHAHADHAKRHRLALMTRATLTLLAPRRQPRRAWLLEPGETVELGGASLSVFDAGHMLGSAQLLFQHQGTRLLYTGDIKLRRPQGGLTHVPSADVLVVESTYGKPHFRFPEPDCIAEEVALWCWRSLQAGVTPVLLAHALGKAQELMLALGRFGLSFALEHRCVPFARAYQRAGIALPDWVELTSVETDPGQRVVIAPPTGKSAIRRLIRHRTALVSGWAQDPGFSRVFGADCSFPLSDHCDFEELLQVVDTCGADKVYTVHGFAEDLARHLRRRGVHAHALRSTEQLALTLTYQ